MRSILFFTAVVAMLCANASPAMRRTSRPQMIEEMPDSFYEDHVTVDPLENTMASLHINEQDKPTKSKKLLGGLGKLARKLRKPKHITSGTSDTSTFGTQPFADQDHSEYYSADDQAHYESQLDAAESSNYHEERSTDQGKEIDLSAILGDAMHAVYASQAYGEGPKRKPHHVKVISRATILDLNKLIEDIQIQSQDKRLNYVWKNAASIIETSGNGRDKHFNIEKTLLKWINEGVNFGRPDPQIEALIPKKERIEMYTTLAYYLEAHGLLFAGGAALPMAQALELQASYGNLATSLALASEHEGLIEAAAKHMLKLKSNAERS